ncbi:MAG: septum formation protein Maf [Treponema sp.]|nr:septum formation protein Maf [Candidatus Treponema caballi]
MEPIILASSSPRRQDILRKLNVPFRVVVPSFKEVLPPDISVEDASEYFASKKVESVVKQCSANQTVPWVLGADTSVIYEGKLFGKPSGRDEAEQFLRTFSGKTHQVITAIAVFNGELNYFDTRVSRNDVTFKELTDEEIEWYLNTGEWHGVAGGYRIQENAEMFITEIKGSVSSITGLPIFEFYDIMHEQGYSLLE